MHLSKIIATLFFLFILQKSLFKTNNIWLSNSSDSTNTNGYNGFKSSSAIIHFSFDFDRSSGSFNYNNGADLINVSIVKSQPLILVGHAICFVNGEAECNIYDDNGNSIGHTLVKVSMCITGKIQREELVKKYKEFIQDKIKKLILI